MRFVLAFSLLLCAFQTALSQPQLALLKNDKIITRFDEGEDIRFQRKGEKGFIRAVITGIHPGYFMLGEDTIYHHQVAKIDVQHKTLTSFKVAPIGRGLVVAGISLILIDAFNTIVINDKQYEVENNIGRASITLVGLGTMMQVVNNNYFKTGRKRKVVTLNLRQSAVN